jgi:hypothetical protein
VAASGNNGGGCAWLILLIGFLYLLGKCSSDSENSSSLDASGSIKAAALKFVTAGTLNCRQQPSTSAAVVTRLGRADAVETREESQTWTRVSSSAGECWVATRFLSSNQPSVTEAPAELATERPNPSRSAVSSSAIKDKIIEESIDSYPGNCPCPYNTDRAGRRCGRRSAYSREGGYGPKCYPGDVSSEDIAVFRSAN